MNSWLRALESAFPLALTIVVLVTVVLVSAIVISMLLKRSPAARHAIVASALITVGLSPVMVIVAPHLGAMHFVPIPKAMILNGAVLRQVPAEVPHANPPATANNVSAREILLLFWMVGTLFGTVRLCRGFRMMARIRRLAQPISTELQDAIHDHLPCDRR